MSAKWSISNLPALAAICLLMLWCGPLSAQERDTVIIVKHDTVYLQHKPDTVVTGRVRHSRYDRRVHRYRKRWEALIPTHTKIQFAGNMGLLSLGTGWDYGKRNQWETDVFLGVLPKYQSDCTKLTFTLKQNYIPWSLQIKESRFSVMAKTHKRQTLLYLVQMQLMHLLEHMHQESVLFLCFLLLLALLLLHQDQIFLEFPHLLLILYFYHLSINLLMFQF